MMPYSRVLKSKSLCLSLSLQSYVVIQCRVIKIDNLAKQDIDDICCSLTVLVQVPWNRPIRSYQPYHSTVYESNLRQDNDGAEDVRQLAVPHHRI